MQAEARDYSPVSDPLHRTHVQAAPDPCDLPHEQKPASSHAHPYFLRPCSCTIEASLASSPVLRPPYRSLVSNPPLQDSSLLWRFLLCATFLLCPILVHSTPLAVAIGPLMQLKEMVLALLHESDLRLSDDFVETIVNQTFKQADFNCDGKIDPAEWKEFVKKNPSLLKNMTLPYLMKLLPPVNYLHVQSLLSGI